MVTSGKTEFNQEKRNARYTCRLTGTSRCQKKGEQRSWGGSIRETVSDAAWNEESINTREARKKWTRSSQRIKQVTDNRSRQTTVLGLLCVGDVSCVEELLVNFGVP